MFLLFKKGYDPLAFEKELTQITASITSTQEQIYKLSRRKRSTRKTTIHYLLVIYIVGNLYNYTQIPQIPNTTRFQAIIKGLSRNQWIFVIVYPIILYFLVRLLGGLYDWLLKSRQTKLSSLQERHKLKIEELKKITNFNTTSELLEKYGDPNERKRKTANVIDKGTSSGAQGIPGNGNLKQRLNVNPGTINVSKPISEMKPGLQKQEQQQPLEGLQQKQQPSSSKPSDINNKRSPSSSHQEVQSQRSFQDRLLDILVGSDYSETIESRYALICAGCFKHNGLASPGCTEPHKVPYICPQCGLFNGEMQEPPNGLYPNYIGPELSQSPVPSEGIESVPKEDLENVSVPSPVLAKEPNTKIEKEPMLVEHSRSLSPNQDDTTSK